MSPEFQLFRNLNPLAFLFSVVIFSGGIVWWFCINFTYTNGSFIPLIIGVTFGVVIGLGSCGKFGYGSAYVVIMSLFSLTALMLYGFFLTHNLLLIGVAVVTAVMFSTQSYFLYKKIQTSI